MKNRVIILIGLIILTASIFSACSNKWSDRASEFSTSSSVQNKENAENLNMDYPSEYYKSEIYSDGKDDNEVSFESSTKRLESEHNKEKTSSTESASIQTTKPDNTYTEKSTQPTERITDSIQTDKPVTKPPATDADGWIIGWY